MWASGVAIFGGTVLATLGVLQFFEGLSAVLKDDVYVKAPNYTYQFDLTAWGWIHLLIGLGAVLVGVSILMGKTWAYVTGIAIACVSTLANFLFIPQQPIWALVIIAFNLAVIWALCRKLEV
jgi:hypothetical protein